MKTIEGKLEADRRHLLDLSLRNTLLNFRVLKSRGVEITDELPDQVHRILVLDSKTMSFLPAPEEKDSVDLFAENDTPVFDQPDEENGENGIAERHLDNKLQTPHSSKILQRRLLNTYYAARSSIEEHGVNTLFLALGVLRWYESEDSEQERLAPLLLIPVELERPSVRSRFKIQHSGDDVGSNLSLQHKLKLDFGLELPCLPVDDDVDVPTFLDSVSLAIRDLPRWNVDASAIHLGFFSFTKFLMYEDLDPGNWSDGTGPADHPILAQLLGDGFRDSSAVIQPGGKLDNLVNLAETNHIWDADSSQTLAILDALSGQNLVIQGPPGTGKSQTITNLIAECLAAEKKVLFVAEKMAALEVVKRRLDNAGIGVACLELHSHKSNRKSVLEDLSKTLKLGKPRTEADEGYVECLESSQEELGEYCRELHRPINESAVTPFQAYGQLLRLDRALDGVELPNLDSREMRDLDKQGFERGLQQAEKLQVLLKEIGVPTSHPFWGAQIQALLPAKRQEIERKSEEASGDFEKLLEAAIRLSQEAGLEIPSNLDEVESLIRAVQLLLDAPPLEGMAVSDARWAPQADEIQAALETGQRLRRLHLEHDAQLLPESWEDEVLKIRKSLAVYGKKWWRIFSTEFRTARRQCLSLFRGETPRRHEERLQILDAILDAQRMNRVLEEERELIASLFGSHWKGYESDWDLLPRVGEYLSKLHSEVEKRLLPEQVIDYLASSGDRQELASRAIAVKKCSQELAEKLERLFQLVELNAEMRCGKGGITSTPLDDVGRMLSQWRSNAEALQDIVRYNACAKAMQGGVQDDLLEIAERWPGASDHLAHLWSKTWYDGLIEEAMNERPVLAAFDSPTHQNTLEKFRHADKWLQKRNRALVAARHWERLPRGGGQGQIGTLRREFEKKRRHLPIRRLLQSAGQAIQAIKPVFMMSPLSVAAYIPPDHLDFDVVIFDEASQITPVDAYGAILRGRQAVVVGDSKQLPPSPFFEKLGEFEDEEIEGTGSELESILGLFASQNAPERMLRWHYRSRHESLIAVSNWEFYGNKLVVLPSPETDRSNLGLVFHYLPNTAYRRGVGQSFNPKEAEEVAKAVMDHARFRPELTLGVAAFSQRQMQAVLDRLELLRREDPSLEAYFSGHPGEPFFVKNLENVQGDERDVIFISVGYGRTDEGFVAMNFGPLNQDGGERRLNVLITRARRRCEVFTNLKGEDLDLRRSNARGVAALKTFLRYAELGILDLPQSGNRQPDSPFEEEVAHRLRQHGLEIDQQVGTGGFFIDIGIRDPEVPGRYLLGLECDGASYHSAAWARDRDRLRQEVLEGLGWRIHRIWSTDWFRDPDRQIERVFASLEEARALSRELALTEATKSLSSPAVQDCVQREEHNETFGIELSVVPYTAARLEGIKPATKIHRAPPQKVANWIASVVAVESPVHFNEVASRIVSAAGVQRVGNRIRDKLWKGVILADRQKIIRRKGEFLWKTAMEEPPVRSRSKLPNGSRKIELIAPEEIKAAIQKIVGASVAIDEQAICQQTCRLFGFARTTNGMQTHVAAIVERMLDEGELVKEKDYLVVSRASSYE